MRALYLNILALGFVLNFVWEMVQMPLYAGMARRPPGQTTLICLRATAVDVSVLLVAFWLLILVGRIHRPWIVEIAIPRVVQFTLVSFVLGVALELIATRLLHHYTYDVTMPRLPVFDLGLAPVLLWLLLPPTILSIADWRAGTLRMEP
jgi:hypothetical protein